MYKGLPIPFVDYLPKIIRQDPDAKAIALAAKMDSIMLGVLEDVIGLNDLRDPARCPADLLVELGDMLAAGILPGDSELIRRRKIASAVQGHKLRGSWAYDAKPKVDAIAGGDAVIFRGYESDDWIMCGDGSLESPTNYWGSMGADGIDLHLGLSLIGEGTEVEVAGNIYVDVDNAALTPSQVQAIVDSLVDIVPAYMLVHLGYTTGTQFIEYEVI